MNSLLRIACLGEFSARLEDIPIPALANSKPLALWLYLALGLRKRSRAQLANFFWGELEEAAARAILRLALLRLRECVPQHIYADRHNVEIPSGCRYEIDALALTDDGCDGSTLDPLLRFRREDFLASARLRHSPQFDEWATPWRVKPEKKSMRVDPQTSKTV